MDLVEGIGMDERVGFVGVCREVRGKLMVMGDK